MSDTGGMDGYGFYSLDELNWTHIYDLGNVIRAVGYEYADTKHDHTAGIIDVDMEVDKDRYRQFHSELTLGINGQRSMEDVVNRLHLLGANVTTWTSHR